jgi:plastocyanin
MVEMRRMHAHMLRKRLVFGGVLGVAGAFLVCAAPASAGGGPPAASYDGMTTYRCKMGPIQLHPGQNLNLLGFTKTCPHAEKVSGPGDTSVFDPGSTAEGYVTRFKPSMVEIKPGGRLVTPSVWDLHLHHVVWLAPGRGPTFASGEEKTIARMPQGYGLPVGGDDTWSVNYMIHSLNASQNRRVYMTWEIDWVPETEPERTDIQPIAIRWMDVAGSPQIYPVFDAERGFDADGDGKFVFPDEVPANPAEPGYEERGKISPSGIWALTQDVTLVGGAGHLHPGGLHVDLEVARDGDDADSIDGNDPSEIKPLFRSDAHYYEPAGAVSWDVSMEATRPTWRISLKAGDVLSIDTTYNVKRASWYESMGILPLAYTTADDPMARDPFDDAAEVEAMYQAGGVLTHGRLPENIDSRARKNLGLPDPRKLRPSKRKLTSSGIKIKSFSYSLGGYSATRGFPTGLMRPPVVRPGTRVRFTNLDALSSMTQTQQAWHSITSCKPPCNRGAGIGYPLAAGPLKFDSGQLGYGITDFNPNLSAEVTTGSNQYRTPPLKAGKGKKRVRTYTYFCRIHPFMRGSIRVAAKKR